MQHLPLLVFNIPSAFCLLLSLCKCPSPLLPVARWFRFHAILDASHSPGLNLDRQVINNITNWPLNYALTKNQRARRGVRLRYLGAPIRGRISIWWNLLVRLPAKRPLCDHRSPILVSLLQQEGEPPTRIPFDPKAEYIALSSQPRAFRNRTLARRAQSADTCISGLEPLTDFFALFIRSFRSSSSQSNRCLSLENRIQP